METKVHSLKIYPKFFEDVKSGAKKFEIRLNDRDFQVGDILKLKEWNYIKEKYTGREMEVIVTYILKHGEGYGLHEGFCIMSIELFQEQ